MSINVPTTWKKPATDGRIVVGVADLAVTDDAECTLVTYALGSCIAVTVYDPLARVGGMLHFMLPGFGGSQEQAEDKPAMFADSGIPLLFHQCYELGAEKERLVVCAAGGAEVLAHDGNFKIGSRNRTVLRKLFWKNDILLSAVETGGSVSRTLSMKMIDGTVSVRHKGQESVLWPL